MKDIRRKEKAIREIDEICKILRETRYITIAMCKDEIPYLVTLNHGYDQKKNVIYFHCAHEGKKIEMMEQNDKVCVEVDEITGIKPGKNACGFGVKYKSVIASGKASIVTDPSEKKASLDLLMEKYSDHADWDYLPAALEKIHAIKIEIDEMTGKKSR